MKIKRYTFKGRGPHYSLHPAVGVKIGPLIVLGVWFIRRRDREMTPGGKRLLERLSGSVAA